MKHIHKLFLTASIIFLSSCNPPRSTYICKVAQFQEPNGDYYFTINQPMYTDSNTPTSINEGDVFIGCVGE